MVTTTYLNSKQLEVPINYEWDRLIANGFQSLPGEDHPRLWQSLQGINIHAGYALGVACSEWVIARLKHLTDVSDARLRLEAAWMALVDWRYASLPEPAVPRTAANPDPVLEPLWLAKLFLTYLLNDYIAMYRGGEDGVAGSTIRECLLARHVVPKKAGFNKWLEASLRKAHALGPATDVPVEKQSSVAPDFFTPEFKVTRKAVAASQARLLTTVDPSKNPYLRKAAQMRADGFKGNPYSSGKGK